MAAAPLAAVAAERMEYRISWMGMTVGAMEVTNGASPGGALTRAIRVRSSGWAAGLYPVDTTLECQIAPSPEGPRHTVVKRVREKDFVQDDTLTLWPDSGRALWSEAIGKTCTTSALPRGTRDLVSFFFDMRGTLGRDTTRTGGTYRLAMDGKAHDLDIHVGKAEVVASPFGPLDATPIRLASRSPTLFSRNRPRQIWISQVSPAVLIADIRVPVGTVRARLIRWERDGVPVKWETPTNTQSRGTGAPPVTRPVTVNSR